MRDGSTAVEELEEKERRQETGEVREKIDV